MGENEELCEQAEKLANQIKQSIVHLNNLKSLCDLCEEENKKVQFTALRATFQVFNYLIKKKPEFIESFTIFSSQDDEHVSKKQKREEERMEIINFLNSTYKDYIDILLNQLKSQDSIFQVQALEFLMKLVKIELETKSKLFGEEGKDIKVHAKIFGSSIQVIEHIVKCITLGEVSEISNKKAEDTEIPLISYSPELLKKFKEYFHENDDLKALLLKILIDLIKNKLQGSTVPERFIYNVHLLIQNIPNPNPKTLESFYIFDVAKFPILKHKSVKDLLDSFTGDTFTIAEKLGKRSRTVEEKFSDADKFLLNFCMLIFHSASYHKNLFTRTWKNFLKLKLPIKIYRQILIEMPQSIIPYFTNPTLLGDFFTDSYNLGGINSILALQGLFILMTKYNLDYPNFYNKLYSLLQPSIFVTKYAGQFFKLCRIFFSSSYLPEYLCATFCKRLVRLCLLAPPPHVLPVLPLVYNILLSHPQLAYLLHKLPELNTKGGLMVASANGAENKDSFLFDEQDPAKADAKNTSLWEIKALRQHYYPAVSRFSKVFEKRIETTSEPYLLDNFVDHSYESEFDANINKKRKGKKSVPLTFKCEGKFVSEKEHEESFPCWDF